jgi:prevent-host-death family protein
MKKTYSTYEAKAQFSAILRLVRERGETVIVSYHGEPVAEIRPVRRAAEDPLRERLRRLEERGGVVREGPRRGRPEPTARKPGALERFLIDRE